VALADFKSVGVPASPGWVGSIPMRFRQHLPRAGSSYDLAPRGALKNGVVPALVLGVPLALGVAAGGYFVGRGLFVARASERVVIVKGLAEREVPANLAMWPIVFSTTGNDLVAVQGTLDASAKKVFAFLERRGFAVSDYSLSSPRVTDREARGGRMRGEAGDRYVAEQTVTLRSGKIAAVKESMQRSGELIREGAALMRSYEYKTSQRRLDAAGREQTAVPQHPMAVARYRGGSGYLVVASSNAQQGYFEIQDRDPFSPEIMKAA
jgi:uncharacterized protein